MSRGTEIQILCLNDSCATWFPSPISFGDMESFDSSMLVGNSVQCPKCGKMTPCNKENMRVHSPKGGFHGADT